MKTYPKHARQQGMTLIELMIALFVGAIMITGTLMLMLSAQRSRLTHEMLSQVQENGRIAISWIARDLRMTGNRGLTYTLSYMAKTTVPELQPSINGGCFTTATQVMDWGLALLPTATGERTPAVIGENNVSQSGSDVFGACIANGSAMANSDIVSTHYLKPAAVADTDLQAGNIYVHSGLGKAILFQCPAAVSGSACAALLVDQRTDPSGTAYYPLVSRAYYVRSWSISANDNIPTLVRVELQGDGSTITEPLMEGIQSLQLRYGIDNNDDGFVDQFKSATDMPALNLASGLASDWSKIKSVKVDILATSLITDLRRGSGDTSASLAGETIVYPEKYLSKPFSTTITMRNARIQG